jgi:uncharacterized protein (TIGR03435 family)
MTALAAASNAQQRSFEAASVKANRSGSTEIHFGMPGGGRFTVTNAPLREIIRDAYNIADFQIVEAPDWARVERYDIVAKADGSPEPGEMFAMMQTVLADRFKLKVRREKRELPVYELVRARADGSLGPRVRTSTTDCVALLAAARQGTPLPPSNRVLCGARGGPGKLTVGGMTMDQLAGILWPRVGRTVINRTGIEGSYDLDLDFAPAAPAGVQPPALDIVGADAPSIFTAVQEQLGLRLESAKAPVDVLVVEHVERPSDE